MPPITDRRHLRYAVRSGTISNAKVIALAW
jgi:hypothetical protein